MVDDGSPYEKCLWCDARLPFVPVIDLSGKTPLPTCASCGHGGYEVRSLLRVRTHVRPTRTGGSPRSDSAAGRDVLHGVRL